MFPLHSPNLNHYTSHCNSIESSSEKVIFLKTFEPRTTSNSLGDQENLTHTTSKKTSSHFGSWWMLHLQATFAHRISIYHVILYWYLWRQRFSRHCLFRTLAPLFASCRIRHRYKYTPTVGLPSKNATANLWKLVETSLTKKGGSQPVRSGVTRCQQSMMRPLASIKLYSQKSSSAVWLEELQSSASSYTSRCPWNFTIMAADLSEPASKFF